MIWLGVIIVLLCAIYWFFMSSYSQVFGKFPYKARTDKKQIALTFDDGPNEPYTSEIVDYLRSKNIKATFFQVGKCVDRYPEVTKKIFHDGHLIGNHSLSHKYNKYFTEHDFDKEIAESQAIISGVIGKTPACFRPPWLWRYPKLFKTLKKHELNPVSGEFCDVLEVFQPNAKHIARRVLAKAKPGAIIIFHDGIEAKGGNRSQTAGAVKIVVDELLKQNYQFVTVDKLLGIPDYQ